MEPQKVDCSTQCILLGVVPATDDSTSFTSLFMKHNIYQDERSPDHWNRNSHSECNTNDELICHRRSSRSARHPRKLSLHLSAQRPIPPKLTNKVCGPDYRSEVSTIGVGVSLIQERKEVNDQPLVIVTGSSEKLLDQESLQSIDMENHLFVKKASAVSVASSVFIGDDGKATVTKRVRSATSINESHETAKAIPKRELGARPKNPGETLGIRRKMLAYNDSPIRDRSLGMNDSPNSGTRAHRITKGRAKSQFSSRNNHAEYEHRRSPIRWTRRRDTGTENARRRRYSQQPFNELKSIWINPDTETTTLSSSSSVDMTAETSQALILSPTSVEGTESSKREDIYPSGTSDLKLSAFECVVCKDYLKPPIHQCSKGHCVCANCRSQGDSCPICQTQIRSEPNSELEAMVKSVSFPCKNSSAGCRETFWVEDHGKHESQCLYRPRQCLYVNRSKVQCTWRGVRSGIRGHLKKCHGHSGVVHPFRTLFSVDVFDSTLWANRVHDVEVLFVESEIFELHKVYDSRKLCVWGLLRHILAKDATHKFTYNIRFQPKNIRASVTFNSEVVGGAEELDKAFEKGKRFKFYLDSFSQHALTVFSIHVKIIPKVNVFHQL